MTPRKPQKPRVRSASWRAFSFSLAVYILGLAIVVFGAENAILRYTGIAVISVGSIAVATAVVNLVASISAAMRTAVILAVIGAVAYALWVGATA